MKRRGRVLQQYNSLRCFVWQIPVRDRLILFYTGCCRLLYIPGISCEVPVVLYCLYWRDRNADPGGWVSYLGQSALHCALIPVQMDFLFSCEYHPAFLDAHFLINFTVAALHLCCER